MTRASLFTPFVGLVSRAVAAAAAHSVLALALVLVVLPLSAHAWTVTGRVTTPSGQGIAGVDLDFEDQATGIIIFTPNDDTDANGFYTTTVPTGTYRIFFNAPIGSNYFDDRLDNVTIASNATINMTLAVGVRVSGFVKDTGGAGLFNVDLNFYDSVTGENYGFAGDNTDAAGFYSVLVFPSTTYDILYRPSLGDNHVAYEAAGVAVGASNVARPDVLLATGSFVTGYVFRKGTSIPVADADIDARNAATGQLVTLGFDNTDALGAYQIVLPNGTYDILGMPPVGLGLAGEVRPNVVVAGNTVADTLFLPVGFTLSGVVRDGANAPVFDANLDVVDVARSVEIPMDGDHTNAAGQYAVVVGAGTYNLLYYPPPGMPAAAAVVRNKVISGNTTQPTVFLLPGFVVSGTVRRSGGATVTGSDIDAVQLSDGFVYPTLNDDSGVAGAYAIRVPGGSYRFVADPPAGSGLVADTVVATISANTIIDFELIDTALTGVGDPASTASAGAWLSTPAPNPTRGALRVRFALPPGEASGAARLSVYSAEGRLVRTLGDLVAAPGEQSADWDGLDAAGRPVAGGVYFLRLESGRFAASTKALLLR